jgi:hypothetical protein
MPCALQDSVNQKLERSRKFRSSTNYIIYEPKLESTIILASWKWTGGYTEFAACIP